MNSYQYLGFSTWTPSENSMFVQDVKSFKIVKAECIDGQVVKSIFKWITLVFFFINRQRQTNDELRFAWRANGKRIRKIARSSFSAWCLHVHGPKSLSPHISFLPRSHVYVSMFPCFRIHISMFPEFRKRKTELTENDNFPWFAANGEWKCQTSVCFLQTGMENGSLFSLVGKR